jgi:hypothetical protein
MTPRNIDGMAEGSDAMTGAFVAARYYGGMLTALYALASSGSFEVRPGDGLGPIIREVRDALAIAERDNPDDIDPLCAFLAYLTAAQS